MKSSFVGISITALAGISAALGPAEWRKQAIYQVLTDRFARPDGSTSATCDSSVARYCGGTWKGIIQKLDYIQGLGATAIWISPFVKQIEGVTPHG
jgi:alpha-amylase